MAIVAHAIPETKPHSPCVLCRLSPATVERRTLPLCADCDSAIGEALHFVVKYLNRLKAELRNGGDFERIAEDLDLLHETRADLREAYWGRHDEIERASPGRAIPDVDYLVNHAWRGYPAADLIASLVRADAVLAAQLARLAAD